MSARGGEESAIEHTTPADGNIFLDLGFEPGEAANLLMRADLMMELEAIVKERRLKQKDAAKLFGVSQPRISDLLRGKTETFTIDSLVNMLGNAGYRVTAEVRSVPRQQVAETVAPAAAQA
jgi:predicted XRE-type DNA-binding protein